MNPFIGVISDTHGLLRRQAVEALKGSALIIHAGDVGSGEVLDGLREIAPVAAVRGNMDGGPWTENIPLTDVVPFEESYLYVLHDLFRLDLDPVAAGFQAVISGHSHRPSLKRQKGVLYLNPGSAGPRRFHLPTTVARIQVSGKRLQAEIIELRV